VAELVLKYLKALDWPAVVLAAVLLFLSEYVNCCMVQGC
jgi:hypothetical protein